MTDLTIRTLDATRTIPEETLAALRGRLRGAVALPGEAGYDAARTIWNAMIDRRPALVARCRGAADVMQARQARARREAARRGARRRPQHRRQRGLRRRAADRPLADEVGARRSRRAHRSRRAGRDARPISTARRRRFGLATPLGINSTTGVAGLTLGGGFGWTTRKFGLTDRQSDLGRRRDGRRRSCAGERDGASGPVLGDARRRRQFRRRDLVRVPASSARAAGAVGAHRASARRGEGAAARVPPDRPTRRRTS